MNGFFEDINRNKYLTLIPTNTSTKKDKKYEGLWSKIRYLIRLITKNADDYDKKYMKIKLSSDNELPLNKKIEISSMIIAVRVAFQENKRYHPQVFLMNIYINYE